MSLFIINALYSMNSVKKEIEQPNRHYRNNTLNL